MDAIAVKLFHFSRSLTNSKSLKQIQALHQKYIAFGLQNNVALCKNVINLYISCGVYQSAILVFRRIGNPLDITVWNGVIAAFVKNSRFDEALSLFEDLLRFPNLKPNDYTYPSLLKACAGLGRLDYGKTSHGHLMKLGFLSDVVIVSSLISMYAKCGKFRYAVKLFDEMPERDLGCWNNLISCYYQSGQFEKALDYFERMKNSGLLPNSVSYTVAISSCAQLLDLKRGERIHEEMLKTELATNNYTTSALVDMYGKCDRIEKAKKVFEEIQNKNIVSWNAMIGGYSLIGDSISCIRVLSRMVAENVIPNSRTVSSLLLACAKSSHLQSGRFVHGYIVRNNMTRDIFVDTSLVDMYLKCGAVVPAENIFRLMPKSNTVAWNVMVSGYVSAGCYFEALRVYDDMRLAGIKPDSITLISALTACAQSAALERGKEIHAFIINNRLGPNEILATSLLDMYAKCGAVKEAEGVFNQLSERSVVSWTSMIVAYGSHGRASEALKIFEDMLQAHIKPDKVTFLAVISACSHAGLVDEGQRYYNLMVEEYGIQPTIAVYSCLIDLLGRAGRLHEAYEILQTNVDVKDDVELLSTLFSACHLHGEVDLGEKIGNVLIEKNPDDHSSYVVLENLYSAKKKWDKMRKIRLKRKELGLKKNPGCSWIEVDKRIQLFLACDKKIAEEKGVYGCLSLLYREMEKDEAVNDLCEVI